MQHAALFCMISNRVIVPDSCNIRTGQANFSKRQTSPLNAKDLTFAGQWYIDLRRPLRMLEVFLVINDLQWSVQVNL